MKWKESDFNNGISSIRALLIYGMDAGQVDEFCDKAIEKTEIEKDNLFAIDSNDLKEKQDALFTEACSHSMFGGRKMVIISNAGDSDAKQISELIEHTSLDAIVVVTAGELRAGGGLRSFFENGENIAALPCYTDDARTLATLIQKDLFAAGIKQITPDAMGYMTSHLGGDRGITRSFLTKIALYVDDKKTVELEDVEKCLPDTGAADTDEFLFSLTAGHIHQTMTALDRLFYDNSEPNMLVRMLDSHFKRLMMAVVEGQMPRLFWKVADKFNQAVKIWPESEITGVLVRLNELEKQFRTTGMPAEILLRDFALKLSVRSAKLALRRRN
ncbi:MAG: DNA polymerase III subunit delta [Alphaproteobacteria bacterium]|nr:DNA polymerase III subunit delta [Alphaproteobacteria bacterium]MBN2675436.1 DNA polymerase III subunit delta [Alphaproteobacteria bacterium]